MRLRREAHDESDYSEGGGSRLSKHSADKYCLRRISRSSESDFYREHLFKTDRPLASARFYVQNERPKRGLVSKKRFRACDARDISSPVSPPRLYSHASQLHSTSLRRASPGHVRSCAALASRLRLSPLQPPTPPVKSCSVSAVFQQTEKPGRDGGVFESAHH